MCWSNPEPFEAPTLTSIGAIAPILNLQVTQLWLHPLDVAGEPPMNGAIPPAGHPCRMIVIRRDGSITSVPADITECRRLGAEHGLVEVVRP